jgi:hypothetical protein
MQEQSFMFVWPSNLNRYGNAGWYDCLTNGTSAGVEEPLLPIAFVKVDPLFSPKHRTSQSMGTIFLRQDLTTSQSTMATSFPPPSQRSWGVIPERGHQYFSPGRQRRPCQQH